MSRTHADDLFAIALRRLDIARQECAHWDNEGDGDRYEPCCHEVWEAKQAVNASVRATEVAS